MTQIKGIKSQFPIFKIYPKVVFLDNAGSTLKPQCVIDEMVNAYTKSGVRLSNHFSIVATELRAQVQAARKNIAAFIGANDYREITCIPGTTYGLNQITFGVQHLVSPEHNVVISHFEHSSNMAPWIRLSQNTGCKINFFPTDEQGFVILDRIHEVVNSKTIIISLAIINNSTSVVQDIKNIIKTVRQINPNVLVAVDAAQTIAHTPLNVAEADIDILVFGGHKIYGPLGVGILWMKSTVMNILQPLTLGGGALKGLSKPDASDYPNFQLAPIYERFEAGTINTVGLIVLNRAIQFVQDIGFEAIHNHAHELKKYFMQQIKVLDLAEKITVYNPKLSQPTTVLFNVNGSHPHDVVAYLGQRDIIVRAGDFCAKEVPHRFGETSLLRISFSIYSTLKDIDILLNTIKNADSFLTF